MKVSVHSNEKNKMKQRNIIKQVKIIILLLIFPCFAFSQGNGLYEFIGRNGKYGFMDKTGEVVIPAKYLYVNEFSEGLAFPSCGICNPAQYYYKDL